MDQRSTIRRARKRRMRVAATQNFSGAQSLMVPTRWVKFVVALFLLPICIVLTQTFFTAFARGTVAQRLWAGAGFWFFSLGAVLWSIPCVGFRRLRLRSVFA